MSWLKVGPSKLYLIRMLAVREGIRQTIRKIILFCSITKSIIIITTRRTAVWWPMVQLLSTICSLRTSISVLSRLTEEPMWITNNLWGKSPLTVKFITSSSSTTSSNSFSQIQVHYTGWIRQITIYLERTGPSWKHLRQSFHLEDHPSVWKVLWLVEVLQLTIPIRIRHCIALKATNLYSWCHKPSKSTSLSRTPARWTKRCRNESKRRWIQEEITIPPLTMQRRLTIFKAF